MLENRTGSSASIRNAVSNSIVSRDDTGDGIIELEIGDLMKLDNGDLIDPATDPDASETDPLNEEDSAIAALSLVTKTKKNPLSSTQHHPRHSIVTLQCCCYSQPIDHYNCYDQPSLG